MREQNARVDVIPGALGSERDGVLYILDVSIPIPRRSVYRISRVVEPRSPAAGRVPGGVCPIQRERPNGPIHHVRRWIHGAAARNGEGKARAWDSPPSRPGG